MKRIYLASPYTHADEAVRVQRYEAACNAAAAIMGSGKSVFSPIAHSHPLASFNLPVDFLFWRGWCLSFLRHWATEIHVLTLDGWNKSVGVAAEIAEAEKMALPLVFVCAREGNMQKAMRPGSRR